MGGQPVTGEPRYLPVLIAPELMEQWATRDTEGNRLSWSWGEPDEDGFYTPTVTRNEDDNLRAEARAAALADVTAAAPVLRVRKPHTGGLTQLDSGFNQGVRAVLAAIKELENR